MRRVIRWPAVVAIITGTVLVYASAGAATDDRIAFPDGYRSWTHVSTSMISSGANGANMHHIYANSKAMEGYRTSQFPNGSIIAFDRFGLLVNGATTKAGDRQVVDVMIRDSARFAETGGWGFDEFVGESRTQHSFDASQAVANCFKCHSQRKDNGYVFSGFRDKERLSP
ncbi:MAG: cytochrome P460 family protein [Gemmatimonadaceae bacterium]